MRQETASAIIAGNWGDFPSSNAPVARGGNHRLMFGCFEYFNKGCGCVLGIAAGVIIAVIIVLLIVNFPFAR